MKRGGFFAMMISIGIIGYFAGVIAFSFFEPKNNGPLSEAAAQLSEADYDDAIQSYTHAISLNPKDQTAYAGRGWAYYGKESYEDAKTDFERSKELQRGYYSPNSGLAFIYTRSNEHERSISMLTDALTYGRNEPSASMLYMALGYANIKNKDLYPAITAFSNAIALDSNSLASYVGHVITYSEVGDTQRADEAYQRVIAKQGVDSTLERIFYRCLDQTTKTKNDVIICGMKLIEDI